MTLPASGSISTAQIRTELGGSGAVVIPSSEVRTLTGVSSGPIILPNDFWGKSSFTPDYSISGVDWSDISGVFAGDTNSQTIAGINVTCTLVVTWTGGATGEYNKNSAGFSPISSGGSFTVDNGDTVVFGFTINGGAGTVTVKNSSDGSNTVDTFTYNLSAF